jgi:hypothetical protein
MEGLRGRPLASAATWAAFIFVMSLLENMRVNLSLTDAFSEPGLTGATSPVDVAVVPLEVGAGDFLVPSCDLMEDGLELAAEGSFASSVAAVIFASELMRNEVESVAQGEATDHDTTNDATVRNVGRGWWWLW